MSDSHPHPHPPQPLMAPPEPVIMEVAIYRTNMDLFSAAPMVIRDVKSSALDGPHVVLVDTAGVIYRIEAVGRDFRFTPVERRHA